MASRLWEYIVIRDRAMLEKINEMYRWYPTRNAAFAIVVCADHRKEKSQPMTWLFDIGFAAQSLRLQAEQLGIASVPYLIYPDPGGRVDKFRELLNIPGHVTPAIIIPFGYPAAKGRDQVWDPTIVHREKYKNN